MSIKELISSIINYQFTASGIEAAVKYLIPLLVVIGLIRQAYGFYDTWAESRSLLTSVIACAIMIFWGILGCFIIYYIYKN
jgi:hypothetical protein